MTAASDRVRPSRRAAPLVAVLILGMLLGVGATTPASLQGQSLLGADGLGLPVEALDARTRGIGSLGVGLFGSSLLPVDPSVSRDLQVPMVTMTYQPSWTTYSFGEVEGEVSTSRFPLLGVAYPVRGTGGMVTLTFGSFLDLRWAAEQERTLDLGDDEVRVLDQFDSDGGISALRLGWAHDLHERLDVAVSAGTYLGDVRRSLTRSFAAADLDAAVEPFRVQGRWRFSGPTVTVGATWDAADLLRIGGGATWSGALHADAVDEPDERDRDIDLPTELRLGASGALSPNLSLNVGVSHADWSATSGDLSAGSTVGTVWSYGGGVEWAGPTLIGRTFPLRVGYRRSDLPFRFGGADPTESLFSLGLGLNLLQAQDLPLAAIDLAYEFGDRDAGEFSESFGRATLTVRVAGN